MIKFEGLVLHTIDVKESDLMVQLLTPDEGVCSVYFRGVRKPKARIKKALFTPLALLSLEAQKSKFSDILSGKDVKRIDAQVFALNDFSKTTQLMFMAECVQRVSKPGQADVQFYSWMQSYLADFYQDAYTPSAIIHWFLAFINHMGIGIDYERIPENAIFSFEDGSFKVNSVSEVLNNLENNSFVAALRSNFDKRAERQIIIKVLVRYLEFHFNLTKPLKSYSILREVLD